MIFRLSQKLSDKIKAGTLATLPLDENPFADWSAGLFLVGRSQYILVTNTKSLYSTVIPAKGVTDEKTFIERALSSIREFMEADGQQGVYEHFIAPVSGSVQFAKALNRSVTGSMNDMTKHAAYWSIMARYRHERENAAMISAPDQAAGRRSWRQSARC